MENLSYPPYNWPSPNILSSMSQDYLNIDYTMGLGIPSHDHCFDELMFPDTGLISTKGLDLFREFEVFDAQFQPPSDHSFHVGVTPVLTPYANTLSSSGGGGGGGVPEGECFEDDLGDDCGDGESSETPTVKSRRDRSKTLVSERKRRGGMKDKLYMLRSLVPNITKMDKASIIADSIDYVKDIQNHAKKLAEDIKELECSATLEQVMQMLPLAASEVGHAEKTNLGFRVLQVTACELGEGRFYVTVECNKGSCGVASSLYVAIESLDFFHMERSNYSVAADRIVLTLTLRVTGMQEEMRTAAVRLSVIRALHKEGFILESTTN